MKIAILGAAESGVGAAILAQKKGYEVIVSDNGKIQDHYKQVLDAHHIDWEEGGHTFDRLLEATEVVKSPGIPDTAPIVEAFLAKGVRPLSEIEFAARYTHKKMLCITGSNGKTTTTSLIYHILKEAGYKVALAGNIGHSLALQIAEVGEIDPHTGQVKEEADWYVLEISSFQLDNMYDFRADISVLLNITPDHLDRYSYDMQRYVDSKMRILRNQRAEDVFVYWQDDQYIPTEINKLNSPVTLLGFSDEESPMSRAYGCGALGESSYGFADDAEMVVNASVEFRMKLSELSLPGRHNLRNALAAALATLSAGVSGEDLRRALRSFQGVPHRLEQVAEKQGVLYINDSKATNVDACVVALQAQTRPVVLIIGGTDKGNDYSLLYDLVREKCRALVFLTIDNSKQHASFDALAASQGLPIVEVQSMKDCVSACAALAQTGDVVLLSPCCASFDLFKNMGDRGQQFKDCVAQL